MPFLRFCVVFILVLGFGYTVPTVHAEQSASTVLVPATPVSEVHFKGGYLHQNATEFGRWSQKKNNGDVTYEFFETASDGTTFELTGPNNAVKLLIDLNAKTIMGEWSGHPMAKVYDINGVKPMELPTLAAPAPEPPAVSVPEPAPAPVVMAPPMPDPVPQPVKPTVPVAHVSGTPIKLHTIPPAELQRAEYDGGVFERVGHDEWVERKSDGHSYTFKVIGSDDDSLYLYNRKMKVMVTIDPSQGGSRYAVGGAQLMPLYKLTNLSRDVFTPIPPQPQPQPPQQPGTLSPSEVAACVAVGGYVERAGLAGAERCTKRYRDGGQVCSDSSQCQGQCRASTQVAFGQPASGVCQPTDNPFGCYTEIKNGVAGAGLCVD